MAIDEGLAVETKTASEEPEAIEAQALLGLKVHFISLVESPANKRQFLVKQAALEDGVEIVEKTVRIVESDNTMCEAPFKVDRWPCMCEISNATRRFSYRIWGVITRILEICLHRFPKRYLHQPNLIFR